MRKLTWAAIAAVPLTAGSIAFMAPSALASSHIPASPAGCGSACGTAQASSQGCNCGALSGSDRAGHHVSVDAKWRGQGPSSAVIGYPDFQGDDATSFAAVMHDTGSRRPYYTFVYDPGHWTNACLTAGQHGLLSLKPCTSGRDKAQDFTAWPATAGAQGWNGYHVSSAPGRITAGQRYVLQNNATGGCLADTSSADPGAEQFGGDTRQLVLDGAWSSSGRGSQRYGYQPGQQQYGAAQNVLWTWARA